MKYLFINSVYGVRSTGKIIQKQCRELQQQGHECAVAYGRETVSDPTVLQIKIGSRLDYITHALFTRLFDLHGFCSKRATKRFIKVLDEYQPDVIWMHNLHGYYINIEILFDWLKQHPEVKKYWTLHDCWAFTGHCAYFTMARCEQWRTECQKCTREQKNSYPRTLLFGDPQRNYLRKKALLTGLKSLELITPSRWLADLTRESILAEYAVRVVNNRIDEAVFRPVDSHFRKDHQLEDRFLVLGVAVGWEKTKGFEDFLKLRTVLSDQYVIVLVGVPKKKLSSLPNGVIGMERTADQKALVELYSTADVFVNPTHQDNYPTVNLEARACGTPVVTYSVGGSPESAGYEYVVEEHDILGLAEMIRSICEE